MPKKYKKGKSNRLTHKTSVWTLVAKSRFGAFEDLKSLKAKEKLSLKYRLTEIVEIEGKMFQ